MTKQRCVLHGGNGLSADCAACQGNYSIPDNTLKRLDATFSPTPDAPIDMILFCPDCDTQHIDAPDPIDCPASGAGCSMKPLGPNGEEMCEYCGQGPRWTNPPHRSHKCHVCACIWRPADVPTNGVAEIKTKGKADTCDFKVQRTVSDKIGKLVQDGERWRKLVRCCGYIQDGSDTTVSLFQDDATKTCFVKVGSQSFFGSDGGSFEEAIDFINEPKTPVF